MKSKETILKGKVSVIKGCNYVALPWVHDAMDTYATEKAKGVIKELEESKSYFVDIELVDECIKYIKKHFNLV